MEVSPVDEISACKPKCRIPGRFQPHLIRLGFVGPSSAFVLRYFLPRFMYAFVVRSSIIRRNVVVFLQVIPGGQKVFSRILRAIRMSLLWTCLMPSTSC